MCWVLAGRTGTGNLNGMEYCWGKGGGKAISCKLRSCIFHFIWPAMHICTHTHLPHLLYRRFAKSPV